MEPQTIKIGSLSIILGAIVADGNGYNHIASVTERKTACGEIPENYLLSSDFYLNCPNCLAEIQYRHDHKEARAEELGVVTRIEQK